ncbi:MAG: HNH endonuclease [Solirubrobacteraceae bacterium]
MSRTRHIPPPARHPLVWLTAVAVVSGLVAIGAGSATGGVGASATLAPVTRHSGCRLRGALPDPGCTPGARFTRTTPAAICRPGYAGSVRNVPRSEKDLVYREYGIVRHFNGANGELDHLVSLELGGSNAAANLFPEAAAPRPASHEKDRLENALHDELCAGRLGLPQAQRLIATDWVGAYRARFG